MKNLKLILIFVAILIVTIGGVSLLFSDDTDLRCSRCSREFKSQDELNDHLYSKHYKKCPYCESWESNDQELEEHKREKHVFPCHKCNRFFPTQTELDNHNCSAQNRKAEQQQRQQTEQQNQQKAEQQEQQANSHPFKCPQCDNRYDTEAELTEHIKATRHYYRCEYCNGDKMGFITKEELERHHKSPKCKKNQKKQTQQQQQRQQTQQQQQAEPDEVFTCKKCGATFPTKAKLNEHRTKCSL